MAATNYSYFDIGGCNCAANPCNSYPCALPLVNLHATISGIGVCNLTYSSITACSWQSSCLANGAGSLVAPVKTIVSGARTLTVYTLGVYPGAGCLFGPTNYTYTVNDLGVVSVSTLSLSSHTCSPLNLVFTGGGFTVTYTL